MFIFDIDIDIEKEKTHGIDRQELEANKQPLCPLFVYFCISLPLSHLDKFNLILFIISSKRTENNRDRLFLMYVE